MKKIVTMSLVAVLAMTGVNAASNAQLSAQLNSLETELANVKKQLKKQNTKINEVKAHDASDNIKWGVDFRTAYDNINYDMADGKSRSNDSLYSMRLWLNMAYAPDSHNIFKGQLSMNKAFGADFGGYDGNGMNRAMSMGGMFDWTANEALTDNNLKVRQAYWLYLGDKAFGADIPWTFSIGRRPATNGFLANLSQDDPAQSPVGHIINVEFDGLSSKLDLSNVTGVPGMSFKVCLGYGSTNAEPLFETATPYATDDTNNLEDVKLGGFIFEPYNDGQFSVKTSWYKAFDLPGMDMAMDPNTGMPVMDNNGNFTYEPTGFNQNGDMQGAAISVLVDGITDDGYFADVKVFGSFAWSKTEPESGSTGMLGSTESETGTSYWFGAYLPVGEDAEYGTVGLEYNHGSQYWRPFTYGEDTMIGSKIAARGDAWEANYTYQINDALSLQARYVNIDYEYTGSNGFFGNYTGGANKIDDMKAGAAGWDQMNNAMGGTLNPTDPNSIGAVALMLDGQDPNAPVAPPSANSQRQAGQMAGAKAMLGNVVEAAQDFRLYLRYRF